MYKSMCIVLLLLSSILLLADPPGPSGTPKVPTTDEWIGCEYQVVTWKVIDPDGVDTSSIMLEIAGETVTFPDPRLDFLYDSLLVFTPSTPFSNSQTYDNNLLTANDLDGNPLQGAPILSWFKTDFDNPYFYPESRFPSPDTIIPTRFFNISVLVTDSTSGIVPVGLCLCINSLNHNCPSSRNSGFCWNPGGGSTYITYIDSLFNVAHNVTNIADEDSVEICLRMAVDRVTESAATCGPNWIDTTDSDLCWSFVVDMAPPTLILDFPSVGDTIACDSLVFHSIDYAGIDTAYTRLRVVGSGSYNCGTSPYLSCSNDTFYFSASSIPPYNEGYITTRVDRFRDLIGNSSISGPSWSFFVDKTPPIVSAPIPVDGSIVSESAPTLSVTITDFRTEVDPSSVVMTVDDTAYTYSDAATSWDGTHFEFDCSTAGVGFSDNDTVEVCITNASDIVRAEFCGPNSIASPYCFEFYIELGGPAAWLISPPDEGFTACTDQEIIWGLYDISGVNLSVTEVNVEGTSYIYPDHLTSIGDSIIFTPTTIYSHGDIINYSLNYAEDSYGNPLSSPVTGEFTVDIQGPEITTITPATGTYFSDFSEILTFSIEDTPAGVDPSTATVEILSTTYPYPSGFSWDGSNLTFDMSILSLSVSHNETLIVCLEIADSVDIDYCGPNTNDTCTYFVFDLEPPEVEFVYPGDSVITACSSGEFKFMFTDENGLDYSTFELTVNGITYSYSDPEIFLRADTIIFSPPAPYTHGTIIELAWTNFADLLGNSTSSETWYVFIDTEAPIITGHNPAAGAFVSDPSPTIRVDFLDTPAGINPITFSITLNSFFYPESSPALYFVGNQLHFSLDSIGTVFSPGDTVEFCVFAAGDLVNSDFCGPNVETIDSCFEFYIDLSGPTATMIFPPSGIVTSCDFQQVRILLEDLNGVVPESTIVEINDVLYPYGDHTSMSGDTLFFVPDVAFTDGDTVEVILARAADSFGSITSDLYIGNFIVDLNPPQLISYVPPEGYLSYLPTVEMVVEDNIAGVDSSSLTITIDGSAYTYADAGITYSSPMFSCDLSVLGVIPVEGDTLDFCLDAIGDMANLCGSNELDDDTCWAYIIDLTHPEAHLILPDSAAFSACPSQEIRIFIDEFVGLNPDSIRLNVNGINYRITSPGLSLSHDTLIFVPSTPYTHGDTVVFQLRRLVDFAGNRTTDFPTWYFIMDLLPPYIVSITPPPGPVSVTTPSFTVEMSDIPSGVEESSIEIDFNTTILTTSSTGVSWDGSEILEIAPGIEITDDSLILCISAYDNVDTLWCGPNIMVDTCFSYLFDIVNPVAYPILPLDGEYSSCSDQQLSIYLHDNIAINTSLLTLTINSTSYTISSPEVNYIGDSLLIFVPAAPFSEGSVDIILSGIEDINGNTISNLDYSFTIDLSPPELVSSTPASESFISTTGESFTFVLSDSYSGIDDSSIIISFAGYAFIPDDSCVTWDGSNFAVTPELCGLEFTDGEDISVCFQIDDSPDYCPPNMLDTCIVYHCNNGGPEASIVEPLNDTYTACSDQRIIIEIIDPSGIDLTSIQLDVDGSIYEITDPELSYSEPNLIFTPSSPFLDADTIEVELVNVEDIHGLSLTTPIEWFFIIDVSPPVFVDVTPPDESAFTSSDVDVSVTLYEPLSGINPASLHLTVGHRSYRFPFSGTDIAFTGDTLTFSFEGIGFSPVDGDTTRICIRELNDTPDYCFPNDLDSAYCFNYFFDYLGPYATMVEPMDSSITSCFDIPLTFFLMDAIGIDTSSIILDVNGTTYTIDDSELEYDGLHLTFTPDFIWTEGEFIPITIIQADDLAGNPLIGAPLEFAFGVDTIAPVLSNPTPEDGALIGESSPSITIDVYDNLSGIYADYSEIVINSTSYSISDDGFYFEDSIFRIDCEEAGIEFLSGDIEVCFENIHDRAILCGPNYAEDFCFTFSVDEGMPHADLITPRENTYSSCPGDSIVIMIRDNNGINWSSLELRINDIRYTYSSSEVTVISDSMVWVDYDEEIEHGDTIFVLVESVTDSLENLLEMEEPWYFIRDIEAPEIELDSPSSGSFLDMDDLTFIIDDTESGVDSLSIMITTNNGDTLYVSTSGVTYSTDVLTFNSRLLSYIDEDTLEVCITASDNALYCGANTIDSVCYTFYIDNVPPEVGLLLPSASSITSCTNQQLYFELYDTWGIDLDLLRLTVGISTYNILSPELEFRDSVLVFTPSDEYPSGEYINVVLRDIYDLNGNEWESESLAFFFVTDFDPPLIDEISPPHLSVSSDVYQDISVRIRELISSIDESSIALTVNSTTYDIFSSAISFDGIYLDFYPESLGTEYTDGDTITWCIEVSDDADIYCPANQADTCFSFSISTREPRAEILYPSNRSYVSCPPESSIALMRIIDGDGILFDSTEFYDGSYLADIEEDITILGDTILYTAPVLWEDTDTVSLRLDYIVDSLGNPLAIPVSWSFYIDRSSPYIAEFFPTDGEILISEPEYFYIILKDDMSGVERSSVELTVDGILYSDVTGIVFSGDTCFVPRDSLLSELTGDIEFCLHAAHDRITHCSDNYAIPECISVTMASGELSARFITPFNNAIVSCEPSEQEIRILLSSDELIDYTTVRMTVNSDTFRIIDSELTHIGDTLIYTPSATWSDGMTINASLIRVEDILGTGITPIDISFIIDLTPPLSEFIYPAPYTWLGTESPVITAEIHDIHGVDITSIFITYNDDTLVYSGSYMHYDDSILTIDLDAAVVVFSHMDSIMLCIENITDITDICESNDTIICTNIHFDLEGPEMTLVSPADSLITSCPDSAITFMIYDFSGLELDSLSLICNGISYVIDSDEIEYTEDDSLLYFRPSIPFESADTLIIESILIRDSLMNITEIYGISLIIDINAPEILSIYPPDGSIVGLPLITTFELFDDVSGIDYDSIIVSANGVSGIVSSLDGFYVSSDTLYWSSDSSDMSFLSGDTVELCLVQMNDTPDICPANVFDSSVCVSYILNMDGPIVHIITPPSGIWSSCIDQQILFTVVDPDGIEWDSLKFTVNDDLYTSSSPEVSISGDTVSFTPIPAWSHGDIITIEILEAFDLDGYGIGASATRTFMIDIEHPVILDITPSPMDILTDSLPDICITLSDSESGIDISSLAFTANTSRTLDTTSSALTFDGSILCFYSDSLGISYTDSLIICLQLSDNATLCGTNLLDTCITFIIGTDAPYWYHIIPEDGVYSSCAGGIASIVFTDPDGLLYDSLGVILLGDTLLWGESPRELSMNGDTLIWQGTTPLTPGDTLLIYPYGMDVLHNRITDPSPIIVVVDTSAPVTTNLTPLPDNGITNTQAVISIEITDILAGVLDSSIIININTSYSSHTLTPENPAVEFIAGDFSFDPVVFNSGMSWYEGADDSLIFYHEFDTVDISVLYCDKAEYCGNNFDSTVWSFNITDDDTVAPIITHAAPLSIFAGESIELKYILEDGSGIIDDSTRVFYSINSRTLDNTIIGTRIGISDSFTTSITPLNIEDTLFFVVKCCDNDFDFNNPDDIICSESDTIALVALNNLPPQIQPLIPMNGSVSSCDTGYISILIHDDNGIDHESIIISVNDDTLFVEDMLFSEDTVFIPYPEVMVNGESVIVSIISVSDNLGNTLETSYAYSFMYDSQAPELELISPVYGSSVVEGDELVFNVSDNLSGVNIDSLTIYFNEYEILPPYNFDGEYLRLLVPEIEDSLTVTISNLMDMADYCGHNISDDYIFEFVIPGSFTCDGNPSPFTPNGDDYNPVVRFSYPQMDLEGAQIKIFTLNGSCIKEINVSSAYPDRGNAFWDGLDNNGVQSAPGVYIYVITRNGKLLCKGTVTLAR